MTVESTSALVTWASGTNNQQWEVEYGNRGFAHGQGQSYVCDVPNVLLGGLEYNSEYELYVRAYCGSSSYSDWSLAVAFSTGDEPDTLCQGVDSIIVSEVGFTNCALVIHSPYLDESGQNTDSVTFQVVLMHNADTIADTIMSQTDIMFDNLQEGTNYVVYVRTLCDSVHQSGWTLATFATDADTTGIEYDQLSTVAFTLYPNPAREQVHCTLHGASSTGVLIIFDAMGRQLLSQPLSSVSQSIVIRTFPQGLYTVVVRTAVGSSVQRLSVVK